ncbi:beta-L-arabinofuranosidase domain-containing protein [Microbacterium sp. 22215]|uniref:beta-L-arabinofuranosidase domain-containing protein n=1 Tax=Microbacterium sp. 22215 TaxID=3453893 RepID=UPI003F8555E4
MSRLPFARKSTLEVRSLQSPLLDARSRWNALAPGSVQLGDPKLRSLSNRNFDYLLSLDPQRFLHAWFVHAGIPCQSGAGYGGWERDQGLRFTGHFFGHYLSAMAQSATLARDRSRDRAVAALRVAIDGLARVQSELARRDPGNAGYVAPFPVSYLPAGEDGLLVPFYNLHKVLAGLLDVYRHVSGALGDRALLIAAAFGRWLGDWADRYDDDVQLQQTEYGGMNEALYNLFEVTRDPAHLRAAEHFDEIDLFRRLASGEDVLAGKHANTTIPKVIGAITRYRVLAGMNVGGDAPLPADVYRRAAENFFAIVLRDHTYANGGNSIAEHFHPPGTLMNQATNGITWGYGENSTAEGCNVYNMRKLAQALFALTGDVGYADYDEWALRNSVVASANFDTAMVTYFQPMTAGYAKVFGAPQGEFWCDQGTGIESLSALGASSAYSSLGHLAVTQYWTSKIVDLQNDVVLEVTADLPGDDHVQIRVSCGPSVPTVRLHLRIPAWASGEPTLTRHGRVVHRVRQGGFIELTVSDGDEIRLQLPSSITAITHAEDPDWAAFAYGPVLLAAPINRVRVGDSYEAGVLVRMSTADTSSPRVIQVKSPTRWLEDIASHVPAIPGCRLRFQLRDLNRNGDELILEPYEWLDDARYAIYFAVQESEAEDCSDPSRRRAEGQALIDRVTAFDDSNAEAGKAFERSKSATGYQASRRYRAAGPGVGAWFAYTLAVAPTNSLSILQLDLCGGTDAGAFRILVDGELLGVEDMGAHSEGWYTRHISIPQGAIDRARVSVDSRGSELRDGRGEPIRCVRVRLENNGERQARLFGISVLQRAKEDER